MKRTFVTALALVCFAVAAYAQQSPPPDTAPPAAAAPGGPPPGGRPGPANVPQANTKPVDCAAQARQQGLRGPAVRDSVQICREEQRLACLKEAVERKIVGETRRDFIRSCAGLPAGPGGRGGAPEDHG
jgi:hypothetical protein